MTSIIMTSENVEFDPGKEPLQYFFHASNVQGDA